MVKLLGAKLVEACVLLLLLAGSLSVTSCTEGKMAGGAASSRGGWLGCRQSVRPRAVLFTSPLFVNCFFISRGGSRYLQLTKITRNTFRSFFSFDKATDTDSEDRPELRPSVREDTDTESKDTSNLQILSAKMLRNYL